MLRISQNQVLENAMKKTHRHTAISALNFILPCESKSNIQEKTNSDKHFVNPWKIENLTMFQYNYVGYTGWPRKNATPMVTNFKEIRD